MIKIKKIAKYVALCLAGLGCANTSSADMVCSNWQLTGGQYVYSSVPKCFYSVAIGDSPAYCVDDSDLGYNPYVNPNDPNDVCYNTPEDCLAAGYKKVDSFWMSVSEAGGDCNITGGTGFAVLPLTDATLPFLLLAGCYGLFIYRRKKKYRLA